MLAIARERLARDVIAGMIAVSYFATPASAQSGWNMGKSETRCHWERGFGVQAEWVCR